MEQFNAEAKALVEMQNEYVLLTSKNPSEMCHDDFIRAEELNVQIKDATKVMAALAICRLQKRRKRPVGRKIILSLCFLTAFGA